MDLDKDKLEATQSVKQAYNTIYNEMLKYIKLYNELEDNTYSKDKILEALGIEYKNQDLSEEKICNLIKSLLKEKHRVEKENEALKKQIQFRVGYCNKLEEELFEPKVIEITPNFTTNSEFLEKLQKENENELKNMVNDMLE